MSHSDGLDEASSAFLADLTPAAVREAPKLAGSNGPPERLFEGTGVIDDEDGDIAEGEGEQGDESLEDAPAHEGEEGGEATEGEEGEGEEGDDDGEGEGEEGKSDLDLSQEVALTVDGGAVTVPLKEALEGYIRTETFHKRLSQLSEVATSVEEKAKEVDAHRADYVAKIEAVMEQSKLITPKEPTTAEWDEMYRTDPANARVQEQAWKNYHAVQDGLKAEKERVAAELEASNKTKLIGFIQTERSKMLQTFPQWQDTKKRDADFALMRKTALSLGITEPELDKLYDSRMVGILYKAAQYDRIKAAAPKPVVNATKRLVSPGVGNSQRTAPKGNQPMKRLARSGSIEDAASVIARIL